NLDMASAKRRNDEGATRPAATDRKLVKTLRAHLEDSLLPADPPMSAAQLDDAAALVFEAARRRKGGEASLVVRSASGERRATAIAVVNRDMPFLVDSIAGTVAAQGHAIDVLLHPVVAVRRDAAGELVAL